jgi:hypothetical protein
MMFHGAGLAMLFQDPLLYIISSLVFSSMMNSLEPLLLIYFDSLPLPAFSIHSPSLQSLAVRVSELKKKSRKVGTNGQNLKIDVCLNQTGFLDLFLHLGCGEANLSTITIYEGFDEPFIERV